MGGSVAHKVNETALDVGVDPQGHIANLAGRVDVAGKRVGVILSGGNVDLEAVLELFRGLE